MENNNDNKLTRPQLGQNDTGAQTVRVDWSDKSRVYILYFI